MKTDLELLNQKLDQLLGEVAALRLYLQNHSPPAPLSAKPVKLYSLKETARLLGLSTSRVYALTYEGVLTPVQRRRGSRLQFDHITIQSYLYANKQ